MRNTSLPRRCAAALLLAGAFGASVAVHATTVTLKVLDAFGFGQMGSRPQGDFIAAQDHSGRYFGNSGGDGGNDHGSIYSTDLQGLPTILHKFEGGEGGELKAGLVQGPDGSLYGVTDGYPHGTIFRLAPDSRMTVLHVFSPDDGYPTVGLLLASDGFLYGVTEGPGRWTGRLFRISMSGDYQVLHTFGAVPGDGARPEGRLIQASNGDILGTTVETKPNLGGTTPDLRAGEGTVFKLTPDGQYAIVAVFPHDGHLGTGPEAGLVDGRDGWFYGTTYGGGAEYRGTVYRVAESGELQLVHAFRFQGRDEGSSSTTPLTLGSDGLFYGTQTTGGRHRKEGPGTAYRVDRAGNFELLYVFDFADGFTPQGALLETSPGQFLGSTYQGGPAKGGVDFLLEVH